MNFHVMTLFPEMVMNGLNTSILGRAASNGLLSFEAINIRDYTLERHGKVDDYPYGGGAGMVMQAEPIYRAYTALCDRIGHRPRVVYMTPQGRTFTQKIAEELAKEEELVFLCGHYEGVDERVLEMIATDYLSAGDYVLTGGELPAMMMIDCISRLVPGVLNNDVSAEFESFHDNLLEYPQYSRPEEFMGKKVPEILLSGHHANIEKWRREQSIIRTLERRPELLEEAVLSKKEKLFLEELLRKKAENQEEDTIYSLQFGQTYAIIINREIRDGPLPRTDTHTAGKNIEYFKEVHEHERNYQEYRSRPVKGNCTELQRR